MDTATVIRLEDHRKSAAPAVSVLTESPGNARRAPAATFHYPPAQPIVDWMPGRDVSDQVDAAFRWLAFFALAGAGAILAGAVLTTLAGAFAAVAAGGV